MANLDMVMNDKCENTNNTKQMHFNTKQKTNTTKEYLKRRYGFCSKYSRRKRKTFVLPKKFLLGGNINDPLNLASLSGSNQITPQSSPLPTPKHKDTNDMLMPYSEPLDNEENGRSSLVNTNHSNNDDSNSKNNNKGYRKTRRKGRKRTTSETTLDSEDGHIEAGNESRFNEIVDNKSGSDSSLSKVPSVKRRKVENRRNFRSIQNNLLNHRFRPKDAKFQYGNYNRYYGYRNSKTSPDPRLRCFKREWFENNDVLDIGCNIGHITLTIARDFNPRKIVGLDIDESLINIAEKNIRHYLVSENKKSESDSKSLPNGYANPVEPNNQTNKEQSESTHSCQIANQQEYNEGIPNKQDNINGNESSQSSGIDEKCNLNSDNKCDENCNNLSSKDIDDISTPSLLNISCDNDSGMKVLNLLPDSNQQIFSNVDDSKNSYAVSLSPSQLLVNQNTISNEETLSTTSEIPIDDNEGSKLNTSIDKSLDKSESSSLEKLDLNERSCVRYTSNQEKLCLNDESENQKSPNSEALINSANKESQQCLNKKSHFANSVDLSSKNEICEKGSDKLIENIISPTFPNNVSFVTCNYVLEHDEDLLKDKQIYDCILCLSLTKWIHLNFGDDGLKRSFKRMYAQLKEGGKLILEAQPWCSYKKKKFLTECTLKNYWSIKFKPEHFNEYLLSKEVGFSTLQLIDTPAHQSKGFRRPIYLFTKGQVNC